MGTLSGHSSDILQYIFTYLDHDTSIIIWQTCKRFNWVVSDKVPITFTVRDVSRCLRLVSLFNKVKFKVPYANSINNNACRRIGNHIIALHMDYNSTITNYGLQHTPNLNSLKFISNNSITNYALQYCPKLKYLHLEHNRSITDEGLQYCPQLTNLSLSHNNTITDYGLQYTPNLTTLSLGWNDKITGTALQYVPHLTNLDLMGDNNITDGDIQSLPKLTNLDLRLNTRITDKTKELLKTKGVNITLSRRLINQS